jgi:phosphoglycolate phosphatase
MHSVVSTKLYGGIFELLSKLKDRRFKMSVFSNKAHDLTCHIIDTLLPGFRFTEVIGAREGQPKKPDPAVALFLCSQMRLVPEEVIYFGDSDVDMLMARKAGFLAVGVTWGFRSPEELLTNGAELLISQPLEILERLGNSAGA